MIYFCWVGEPQLQIYQGVFILSIAKALFPTGRASGCPTKTFGVLSRARRDRTPITVQGYFRSNKKRRTIQKTIEISIAPDLVRRLEIQSVTDSACTN